MTESVYQRYDIVDEADLVDGLGRLGSLEHTTHAEVAKLADAQDLKSVCRDRRGAETLVFCWRFGPSFWLALGALGW